MSLTPAQPAPRRNRGCLWGCLAMIAFLALPLLLAAGYGGWFLYQGYRHDPVLRAVGEMLRHDGMAAQVLGDHIRITGVEGSAVFFSYLPGHHETGHYILDLEGSRGGGTLAVDAHEDHGQLKVERMILTAPDGGRFDLLHHVIQSVPETDSI